MAEFDIELEVFLVWFKYVSMFKMRSLLFIGPAGRSILYFKMGYAIVDFAPPNFKSLLELIFLSLFFLDGTDGTDKSDGYFLI